MAVDVKKSLFRLKSDKMYRSKVGLYYGAVLNLAFVALQLYGGIRYRSAWFTSLAIYYAALGGVKAYLAHSLGKNGKSGWMVFQIASISTPQINSITGAIEEFGSVTKAPDWVSEWLAGTFRTLATTNNITGMLVAIFAVTVTLYMIIRGTKEGKRFRK